MMNQDDCDGNNQRVCHKELRVFKFCWWRAQEYKGRAEGLTFSL